MKKHMILALPAVIFLCSQFLVSYLTCQGRNMEKELLYFSLALVFIFFLSSLLKITNDIGKSWCFRIFWIFLSKSCGQVDDKEYSRSTNKVISMLMIAFSSLLSCQDFGKCLGSVCKWSLSPGANKGVRRCSACLPFPLYSFTLCFPKEQDQIKAMQRTVLLINWMLELWDVNR